jgi:glycosyltransferase involved in cell wall biosynthesis
VKLIYVANIRIPTEKAHGLQIMQNCEALADQGAEVQLWVTRRINTAEMKAVSDPFAHYGVKQNFSLRRLACLDLLPLVPNRTDLPAKIIFGLQYATFALMVLVAALFSPRDVIFYSRDPLVLLALSLIKPRRKLAYEAHNRLTGRISGRIQNRVLRRVGHVFAVTRKLADDLITEGADSTHMRVAHDGVRAERFANMPNREEARQRLGWDQALLVVGYVGRLHTMAMDKGVGTLVEALAKIGECGIALVGGPDDMAEDLRARWIALGQDAERFLYAGQVATGDVPLYLAAFDACAMPFPCTTHFAYYMSPLKLFEYMAAKRPILASDLPSIREVLTDNETALLTPPDDVDALAAAIQRLRDGAALRDRLAANAYRAVMEQYTWEARAKMILNALTTI